MEPITPADLRGYARFFVEDECSGVAFALRWAADEIERLQKIVADSVPQGDKS